jgi:DNA-directed RNA polymerase subunit L/DNA-directed RNA polymerase alpha subunit
MESPVSSQVFFNLAKVDGDEGILSFQLKNTLVSYANTLRRMLLTGTESIAFNSRMNDSGATSDVIVEANTTPMTNEMLADRIGLIPIFGDPTTWNPEEYTFKLDVTNETPDPLPVFASDFKVYKKGRPGEDPILDAQGSRKFFHPNMLSGDTCLIAMLKGQLPNQAPQKIKITARATVGTGREHIRWSPVSQCSYAYTIDTDEGRQQEYFARWLENTKKLSVRKLEDDPPKKEAMIREFQTMEVQRCFKRNEKGEPDSFEFLIETIGMQPIADIVERALLNLEKKCSLYSGDLPTDIRVQPADARMKGFDFFFPREDHTLGNLLQTWMEDTMMESGDVTFVGYKVPHPLRDEMVLRVGVDFPSQPDKDGKEFVARGAVSRASAACAMMFRQWREDWNRVMSEPIGSRTRASLRLNITNARALEEAAARAAPVREGVAVGPRAARTAQKSAFYGKYVELQETGRREAEAARQAAAAQAAAQAQPSAWAGYAPGGTTGWAAPSTYAVPAGYEPPRSPAYAPASPEYGAASPAYAPTSPAYRPSNFGNGGPGGPAAPSGTPLYGRTPEFGASGNGSAGPGAGLAAATSSGTSLALSPAYGPASPAYRPSSPAAPTAAPTAAADAEAQALAAGLPTGWTVVRSGAGKLYYYAPDTGVTRWNRPTEPA